MPDCLLSAPFSILWPGWQSFSGKQDYPYIRKGCWKFKALSPVCSGLAFLWQVRKQLRREKTPLNVYLNLWPKSRSDILFWYADLVCHTGILSLSTSAEDTTCSYMIWVRKFFIEIVSFSFACNNTGQWPPDLWIWGFSHSYPPE